MIVPEYWAEARRQQRASGRQVTVRRYGWSDTSEAEAISHAEARASEALRRILAGDKLARSEPKVPYNGAEGVPIREEVLARHGEQVITRNSYGARCLNSPNALFADIDFEPQPPLRYAALAFALLSLGAIVAGLYRHSWAMTIGLLVFALLASGPLARGVSKLSVTVRGGHERIARSRLDAFLNRNPSWGVRLYRTPAGYRVLATHQPFDAKSAEVRQFFDAVAADPIYIRMCANQRCFRARLTAKPWRIGISDHLRPRPGVWPVRPERRTIRDAWLRQYDAKAASYSACRFLESLGTRTVHASIERVIDLHDRESGALIGGSALA